MVLKYGKVMRNKEKKLKVVQIRITETDKKLIKKIREKDPKFNLSNMLRLSLHEYYLRVCPPNEQ